MQTSGFSDIGRKRTHNEDDFRLGACSEKVVWSVVCDGMGGARGGSTASSMAVQMVSQKIDMCYNERMNDFSIENMLLSAITTANVTVYDRSISDEALNGMGTTIVACVAKNDFACIAHVGDSRAYLIRDGRAQQLTKDHSLVQYMLDNGEITAEQFEKNPNKNIITRAVGVSEEVDIDFKTIDIMPGDIILLCTDGFSGFVDEKTMVELCQTVAFDELARACVEAANEHGGLDNITVALIKC